MQNLIHVRTKCMLVVKKEKTTMMSHLGWVYVRQSFDLDLLE